MKLTACSDQNALRCETYSGRVSSWLFESSHFKRGHQRRLSRTHAATSPSPTESCLWMRSSKQSIWVGLCTRSYTCKPPDFDSRRLSKLRKRLAQCQWFYSLQRDPDGQERSKVIEDRGCSCYFWLWLSLFSNIEEHCFSHLHCI